MSGYEQSSTVIRLIFFSFCTLLANAIKADREKCSHLGHTYNFSRNVEAEVDAVYFATKLN